MDGELFSSYEQVFDLWENGNGFERRFVCLTFVIASWALLNSKKNGKTILHHLWIMKLISYG